MSPKTHQQHPKIPRNLQVTSCNNIYTELKPRRIEVYK